VKVLLDTHALLWALSDDERLSETAHGLIIDASNEIMVSVVSAWEMAVKQALGKLQVPTDLERVIAEAGFVQRLTTFSDCRRLATLPAIHRDPFDRMLVAQALEDGIPIVTRDETIAQYQVQTIW